MKIEITSGRQMKAIRCLIYGPEGIGKTTFASQWPDPLYIDTEGSTSTMDVKRLPVPTSLEELLEIIDWVVMTKPCRTLVIDTVDWLEKIICEDMCISAGKTGIEDWGYGKGYQYLTERMAKVLKALDDVIKAGINVLLVGHAQIKQVQDPSLDPYDHWELKLQKRTAPLFKEWVDAIFFAHYEVTTSSDQNGRIRARGGKKRVMNTVHSAVCDAKNRFGLEDEIPLSFESIEHIFDGQPAPVPEPAPEPEITSGVQEDDPLIMLGDLIDRSKIDRRDFVDYIWMQFESNAEIIGHKPDQWPEGFIRMLIGNWEKIQDDLAPVDDDVLDIERDDLPF